jgi:hypothetical protein
MISPKLCSVFLNQKIHQGSKFTVFLTGRKVIGDSGNEPEN